MKSLVDKTIYIGREPNSNRRLQLSLELDGQVKSTFLGNAGSVPNTVSRCRPSEKRAHCTIVVDSQERVHVINGSEDNKTYINGNSIRTKLIGDIKGITLLLGEDKYEVSLQEVIEKASQIVGVVVGVDISHLEKVYEDYHAAIRRIDKNRLLKNNMKGLYMPIILVGGIVCAALGISRDNKVVYFIAAAVLVIGWILTFIDNSQKKKDELTLRFQKDYVCPKCKCILQNYSYSVLKQNYKNCPFCKVKWNTEK